MRTVRVVMLRTFGALLGSLSTAVAVAVFLGMSGGLFAKALLGGDGGLTPVAVLWALSAAPALPVLTAVLTMRLVADERTSGRLDLSCPTQAAVMSGSVPLSSIWLLIIALRTKT